jgi:hypothetical protein
MSVLDGTMIQLQFGWCGSPGVCVFVADASQILLGCFLTDAHLPGHGFQWETGSAELQSTPCLMTESWPVGGVIGSEDVGEAGRIPVPACGNLLDRRPYLVGGLVFSA